MAKKEKKVAKPEAEVADDFDGIEETAEEVVEEETAEEVVEEEVAKPKPAKKAKKAKAKKEEKLEGELVTYIGAGDTPPNKINFMGRQEFVRGRPVRVTDEVVLKKTLTNQCFARGAVDLEDLAESDEAAAEAAAAQRVEDKAVDARFKKKHG